MTRIRAALITDEMPEEILEIMANMFEREQNEPHTHKCHRCGYRWTHRASDFKNAKEYDEGHTCKKCGQGEVKLKEH